MPVEIKVPSVGESITQGVLGVWRRKDGEWVREGEILFEIETEKVTSEVYTNTSGYLQQLVPEGAEVQVGQVVAMIREGNPPPEHAALQPESAPLQFSPAVRRLVAEKELPAESIPVSGKGGRILKEDILNFEKQKSEPPKDEQLPAIEPPSPEIPSQRETRRPMSQLRKKIAEHLVRAQNTAAILTTFNEADMSNIMSLRAQLQDRFTQKHGVKLGFMSFFVKAVVYALKEIPALNTRLEGDEIVQQNYYDIAVAVGSEKGLWTPVIRNAEKLSFADIEKNIQQLAQRAREGKISLEELEGGIFTISNGGVYGSLLSTPIINAPQCGILGMHAIQERPVVVNKKIEIRPMMYLALSYDHRLVDGRQAVTFLLRIKEFIENPVIGNLNF
ncbi:MAG: 2-oxoglutarate dehydrogenase complex dihydrolipoyllysine-residue succinyltransferase [Verrucomicrobiota bacterium]